jgi:uncharacterized protein (UPF0548 family)
VRRAAEWRVGRGWSEAELAERLRDLHGRQPNFRAAYGDMTPQNGWSLYCSEAVVAREAPGEPVPSGPFSRAQSAVASYQFSDPRIVIGHFDTQSDLLGRRILLELRAFRALHYLTGVVVAAVRHEADDGRHTFGFRYDTLEGHIERGSEWFLLTKDHASGEIGFRIEASWQPGDFPNWWSRVGFHAFGPWYQKLWHRRAHWRLFRTAYGTMSATPPVGDRGIAHAGPAVVFRRTRALRTLPGPRLKEEQTIASS